MNLGEYRHHFKSRLEGQYPNEEIITFFGWLCESYLGLKRAEIPLELKRRLADEETSLLDKARFQLEKNVPIQYLLGEAYFYGMKFKIGPGVLIPRPETEELVDLILKEVPEGQFSVLDIGTGSGCIAIALAKHLPKASVTAIDISSVALDIARKNADLNNVKVEFIESDILKTGFLENKWDVIVSNPPYVLISEMKNMQAHVVEHEPHNALFVPDKDPLLFYKKIAAVAKQSLNKKGKLFFEINEAFGRDTLHMLKSYEFGNIKLLQDIFGKDRMVSAVQTD